MKCRDLHDKPFPQSWVTVIVRTTIQEGIELMELDQLKKKSTGGWGVRKLASELSYHVSYIRRFNPSTFTTGD